MGVSYKASQRMQAKHVLALQKRKLFNDSNDGSVEDNAGTGTSMESEIELQNDGEKMFLVVMGW